MPKIKNRTLPDYQSTQRSTCEISLCEIFYHKEKSLSRIFLKEVLFMNEIEQTLESREVAEMVGKEHSKLLKDIRRYEGQLIEANIGFNDFFRHAEYKDSIGRTLPCYRITKKGCEFIAHKLTGTKGTIFTARYINRFHEMQDILDRNEKQQPWFIRDFRGKKIMLFRDFEAITGVKLSGKYTAWARPDKLVGGYHYNGWGWKCNNEEFRKEYGFDYGTDPCMTYLYSWAIRKALYMVENDVKDKKILTTEAKDMILSGLEEKNKAKLEIPETKIEKVKNNTPIQISIIFNEQGTKII